LLSIKDASTSTTPVRGTQKPSFSAKRVAIHSLARTVEMLWIVRELDNPKIAIFTQHQLALCAAAHARNGLDCPTPGELITVQTSTWRSD